jgi:hypothetical protein
MSKLFTVLACGLLGVAIIVTLAVTMRMTRSTSGIEVRGEVLIATTQPPTQPAPIPSVPDTAFPIIPADTTPSTTLVPRPRATTTTTMVVEETPKATTVIDSTVSLDDPDMPMWRHIALCEMPGPGGVPSEPWGAHWTFIAPKFSGAFGIYNGTWRAAGGSKYGPTAGHATWKQQIEIARVIRDRWGYTAWGCGQ